MVTRLAYRRGYSMVITLPLASVYHQQALQHQVVSLRNVDEGQKPMSWTTTLTVTAVRSLLRVSLTVVRPGQRN